MRARPTRFGRWLQAGGVTAAVILAVLLNVVSARRYRRWDVTRDRLYTLSPPTLQTLHELPERVRLDVLLGRDEPLRASLQLLLAAYQAESDRLDVHYTDPDRQTAELLALQQKYGIEAGKTEEGQIVTDAVLVLSRAAGKPFFIAAGELVDAREEAGEPRSKLEQTLTLTLRRVLRDDRPRMCFTSGHGELRVGEAGPRGLGELVAKLTKNNYEVQEVATGEPEGRNPLEGCVVTIVAGPTLPFLPAESAQLRAALDHGGNLLLAVGPVFEPDQGRSVRLGLDEVAGAAGVAVGDDFVFEAEPSRKLPGGAGDQFLAEPKAHEITQGLVGEQNRDLKVLIKSARSLRVAAAHGSVPAELLSTSAEAFGLHDFFSWAKGKPSEPPRRGPQDEAGPLAIAMAAELEPRAGAERGARVVVLGSVNLLFGQNWEEPVLRGGAMFVESALSWLSARPMIVDVPDKPAFAGARIDEASLGDVYRYVVLYIPAAAVLLGLAVYLRRRATEGHPTAPRAER